jgi:hypothetical protein
VVRPARLAALALMLGLGAAGSVRAQQVEFEALAGLYTASQAEVGAMLELGEDGRYRYQLSYGALDEWSAGVWARQDDAVVLKSDPSVAPAFEVSDEGSSNGNLSVQLVLPSGFDPQYFAITLHRQDGSASFESMASGTLDIPMGDNPVVSMRPVLPVMDVTGPEVAIPAGGAALRIVFKPNDLGFAAFTDEVLERNGDAFELARHGIAVRLRRAR